MARDTALGELLPVDGGDPIPLVRPTMTIGRRESSDICLRFSNVSGSHCELQFQNGVWYVQDLQSTNGVKVNGSRVPRKMLQPGDEVGIATHRFTIQYVLPVGAVMPEAVAEEENLFGQSLMEKAGLVKPKKADRKSHG